MTETENKKQRQLINTARELFIRHGLKRVSVEEICRTAVVSKVTFYKFYKNKDEIILNILDEIMEENLALFKEIMDADIPYVEKFTRIFDLKIQKSREFGPHFLAEIIGGNEKILAFIQQKRIENITLTRQMLEEGQAAGEIAPELTLELFLYYGELLTEAIEDERFKALTPDIQERTLEMTRFFMYGILDRNSKIKGQNKK